MFELGVKGMTWCIDACLATIPDRFRDYLHGRFAAHHYHRQLWRNVPTEQLDLPSSITGFEDLAFLFWSSPANRSFVRQDIDEAALLFSTIRSLKDPHGVEIGRHSGGTTVLLAAAVQNGNLTSIDCNPVDDDRVSRLLHRLKLHPRVELVVGRSESTPLFGPIDFAFIDGDHSFEAAKRDHLRWGEQVGIGGCIIHHDMAKSRPNATQIGELAVLQRHILERQDNCLELAAEAGSLTVFRKTSDNWVHF